LTLSVLEGAELSDTRSLRFGIRQLTYELSLFDHLGRLRRVEVNPTDGSARSERLVDVRHEAIKKTPGGWAESLTAAGESSPAVHDVATRSLDPYLVIRVNGVPIAARGGSWGTDDMLKRVSRDRLEPYFRLHQAANLNIIRNWLGQNTEEVFYDLADEYGLLVLNDFWASTQDFQVEPQDPQLFLANARDVLLRYRNHPSIAVWFGRNEGVPQPIINEGLADLIADLDGTRHYTGSSNSVNLQGSGPYNYRTPDQYFTGLARGFSVEVGTPSLSTLESLEASIPSADRWPISDTLAYHDWHFGGNGDIAGFMSSLERQFGAPRSLADFERKAQMMNYVSYRAVFEGFQAHLWTRNSGRLLWMTHPSWPSNTWQIYSSDYDTQASYYGVKSACEPVHAQMNLPDYSLAVVNTTRRERRSLTLTSRIVSLDGRVLARRIEKVNAPANATTTLAPLTLSVPLEQEGLVLVVLTLDEPGGTRVSENIYWQGLEESSLRKLNSLTPQTVTASSRVLQRDGERVIRVELENRGSIPALAAKLTVVDSEGRRALPALYSDNYLTLLPGEPREVDIRCPAGAGCSRVQIRGWNVEPMTVEADSPGGD
jgi:Exo-beta-D-glucosaminidase Ig-fold domain/Glycosyl hydrolases family 2, TIM barrel domain